MHRTQFNMGCNADPGMFSDRGESEGLRGPAGECGFGAPASGQGKSAPEGEYPDATGIF